MTYSVFTSFKDWQYDTGLKKIKQLAVSGVTVVAGTDLFTSTAHGLVAGTPVVFTTTGTLPAGVSLNTTYYVIASGLTANDFKVSATLGGSTIDVTDTGTGTHSWSARRTVLALYSEIMDEFDELVQLDDTVPMKYNTPTEYELINGWTFNANADLGYLYGGSIKVTATNDLWANFYTLGTLEAGAAVYWGQNNASVAAHPGYVSGHIDQLINVSPLGADTDSRYITAFVRTWTDGYDHFKVQAPTTGGRNPVALATANDLNNQTSSGTVAGAPYNTITVSFGSYARDFNQDSVNENYVVEIDAGGLTALQMYERLKYITRQGETTTLNGVQGQFYKSANAAYAEAKTAPFGTYAGGKFFGAKGVYVTNIVAADLNNLVLTATDDLVYTAPTSIAVAVSSVVSGDRVLMARSVAASFTASMSGTVMTVSAVASGKILIGQEITGAGISANTIVTSLGTGTGGTGTYNINNSQTIGSEAMTGSSVIDKYQFTIASRTSTTVVVNETVGIDIPTTGVLRVGDDRYTYTGLNRGTKTFSGMTSVSAYSAGQPCYVPIIDEQAAGTTVSKSLTYLADFAVIARVRKKGILPFENTGTVGNTGLTVSAIRTADTVAT